jgi:DNA-binding beta-propeller fold protein YncE
MLSSAGEYLAHWQIPNASSDVFSPEHIAVSPDGSTVYATDLAGNRVLVLNAKAAR